MNENPSRREFIKFLGAGTAALFSSQHAFCSKSKDRKPNIVFLYIDDMGWKDTGFMGSRYYETPNIDKLAEGGKIFTNAYANAPNCAPSRACLLSGQYSPRHGIYTVNSSERGSKFRRKIIPVPNNTVLPSDIVTFPEVLRSSGYTCGHFGKWHLGDKTETLPTGQGFDKNAGGNLAGHPKSYFSPYSNKNLEDGPEGEYLTDRLNDEAIRFIENNRDNPFFLYLSHYAVHSPIRGKKEILNKYKNKPGIGGQKDPVYAAMIESIDIGVGNILEKLQELNLIESTVIFFFSDNGGVVGPRKTTSNKPLRGGKGMLYEGGIREPAFVYWPGVVKPDSKCDEPVIGTDLFPTFLEIAGCEIPDEKILDGKSIVPLLKGEKELEREALFWHFPAYLEGKADGARDPYFRTRPCGAVRKGDWKLIEYFEDGDLELYNLKDDIGETENLTLKMPEKVDELFKLMVEWRRSVNAPVPKEKNPFYDPEKDKID
ncbi:sulfatase [candidate division KSB1 bacterium]